MKTFENFGAQAENDRKAAEARQEEALRHIKALQEKREAEVDEEIERAFSTLTKEEIDEDDGVIEEEKAA
jgi:hypothetical protein